MPEQMAASNDNATYDADLESLPVDGDNDSASTDWRAEATRLRQELRRVKDLNRQAVPYVNIAAALKNTPGGQEIIAKLERGEVLTAKQEQKAEAQTGLTQEQLRAELAAFKEQLSAEDQGRRNWEALERRAAEEFPGYEELVKTSGWKTRVKSIIAAISQGVYNDDENFNAEEDPLWFAMKEAYETIAAKNPDIGKLKRVPKTEAERKGEILRGSSKSAGAAGPEQEELSEEQKFARRPIRRAGFSGGIGRSLAELRRPTNSR